MMMTLGFGRTLKKTWMDLLCEGDIALVTACCSYTLCGLSMASGRVSWGRDREILFHGFQNGGWDG